MGRWALIGLIGLGLLAFGMKAFRDRGARAPEVQRGPISVAAVRGAGAGKSHSGGPDMTVDYSKALQDDAAAAQAAVNKYNAAAQQRMNAAGDVPGN